MQALLGALHAPRRRLILGLLLRREHSAGELHQALGDVSFHAGWTFHRAGANRTSRVREVMTIIFIDIDMQIAEPANQDQRNDLGWFPGLRPGDGAASAINPVLWDQAWEGAAS